jgi:LacI family transcriptional regulator
MALTRLTETYKRLKVALIVETTLSPGRKILRGIARYAKEYGPWSIYHEPRGLDAAVPAWLRRWRGDGIIARMQSKQLARAIRETGLPAVDVLGMAHDPRIPLVTVDNRAISRLAVEHLLERGFRHFGCVGIRGINWSQQRRDAFVSSLAEAGCGCAVYHVPAHSRTYVDWEQNLDRLAEWIKQLPKPAGILVCDDLTGQKVLDSCRRVGVPVPEAVAVLGVDNDETVCAVCDPPLSSVDPDHSRVGYEAARLLDEMIGGAAPPRQPVFLDPLEVVTRQSTDILAIEDPDVAMAVGFIQGHAFADLRVDDVVEHVLLSRSALQRRFRDSLGRSVYGEIIRVRVKRACELLAETDMPIGLVAKKAGFRHQAYMGAVFQEKLGKTPGQYRKQAKI